MSETTRFPSFPGPKPTTIISSIPSNAIPSPLSTATNDLKTNNPDQPPQKYSCVLCKERKIKCDRHDPCGACVKARVACVFKVPEPPRRRKRKGDEDEAGGGDVGRDGSGKEKEKEATQGQKRKQRKYEDMLRRAGVEVDGSGGTRDTSSESPSYSEGRVSVPATSVSGYKVRSDDPYQVSSLPYINPRSTRAPDERETYTIVNATYPSSNEKGRLVTRGSKARYMESNLWKVVSAEASQAVLDGSSSESEEDNLEGRRADEQISQTFHSGGLLLGIAEVNELGIVHPDAATILRLWQIYLDNCNPILKLIHAPTLQQEIISAIANLNNISKSLEALMCSIYTLAVMSLTSVEAQTTFGESKERLFFRYSALTRQALLNSTFMRTSEITVLIAFVQYIISLSSSGDFESRWELSGVAMRIAQRIGLHRDPASLGIDPFNCELRRRLWNQIWVLDIRSAEFAGCKTSLPPDSEGVKAPTNCSDSSLFPGMKALPPDQEGFTEMSFILLRVRLGQFLRKVGDPRNGGVQGWDWILDKNVPNEDKREAINACEEIMRSITKYCDMDVPIQATTCRMASIVISKLRWLAHHPRRGLHEKEDQFKNATDLVEVEVDTRLNPMIKRFMWHAANTLQFDSVFFILAELRRRFTGSDIDRAWTILERVYEATPITSIKQSKIFSALRHMTLAAWDAREAAIGKQNVTPTYIQELRRARQGRRARHADGAVVQYPTPLSIGLDEQSSIDGGGGGGGGSVSGSVSAGLSRVQSEFTGSSNTLMAQSPTMMNEPALFGEQADEIDWQLWDQLFSQGSNADYGLYGGEWTVGFKGAGQ